MRSLALRAIRLYQLALSPYLLSSCRYEPTCSQYALQAVEGHGVVRGSWMGLRRLSRCHPWHAKGYDPVPDGPGPTSGARAQPE